MRHFLSFFILITGFLISSDKLSAHAANENGYLLIEQTNSLEFHTTHKSLKDLLSLIRPETREMRTVDFNNFTKDFEDYLNKEVSLCINDREMIFELYDMNLEGHDVVLYFRIQETEFNWVQLEIEIDAFLNIYSKAKNTIRVQGIELHEIFVLDSKRKRVAVRI